MKKVAIIGAGFTGLTAGYELAKRGYDVTIFEKNDNIGGLAGGFTLEGASLEKAYHHLFRTDTDILHLIDELGMHDELGWFESKVGMVVGRAESRGSRIGELEPKEFNVLPFNGVKDLLLYRPLPFFDRIRAGAVLFFLQKYRNWQKLISVSAIEWMTKWSGKNVMRAIWGPLLTGKFSVYASKVSMAWLWARIHIRANSRNSIFEKELLAYPTRGFASIAEKLAKKVAEVQQKSRHNAIRTTVTIEQISYQKGKPVVKLAGVDAEQFDALLSTIPRQTFEKLFEQQAPISNRAAIEYLGAVVLAFSSSQSLSNFYWHNIIAPKAPFLVFLQHTNLVPSSWYNGKHVYYIGVYVPRDHRYMASTTTDEQISTEWFEYISRLFPDFNRGLISEAHLFKFPYAQHVVDTSYPEKIPPYETGLPHTYTANFAQIFPEDRGTNYAVREGSKIADLIYQDLLQSA